jgi:hypothetical protein
VRRYARAWAILSPHCTGRWGGNRPRTDDDARQAPAMTCNTFGPCGSRVMIRLQWAKAGSVTSGGSRVDSPADGWRIYGAWVKQ